MNRATSASFDTSSVRTSERIDFWEACCTADMVGLSCTTLDEEALEARFDRYNLGGEMSVFDISGNQHVITRSAQMVRKHDKDSVFLTFIVRGQAFVNRADRCELLNAGEMVLYDTNTPYMHGFPCHTRQVVFDVPGAEFRTRFPGWDLRDALRIDGRSGQGVPIASAMTRTWADMRRDGAGAGPLAERIWSVFEMTHDLVRGGAQVTAYHMGVTARARAVVRKRIDDADLSAERVAAEVGLSSRQLNRILGLSGLTVKKLIDGERLEHARRAIEAAGPGGANMSDIAFRFGFSSSSHFSKSFRRHFGVAPSSLCGGETARH